MSAEIIVNPGDTQPVSNMTPALPVAHSRGKLLGSVISMLGSDILAKALLIVFFLAVGLLVPVEEMGIYSFAMAVSTFFALAVSFGLKTILVREIARDPTRAREFVETVMWQRGVAMAIGLAALFGLTRIIPYFRPYPLEIMIASAGICMLLMTEVGTGICQGLEHMHWIPAIHAVDGGTRLLSLGILFVLPAQAWTVLTLIFVAQTLTAIVAMAYASRLLGGFPLPRRHPGFLGYAIRQGTPLIFLGMTERTFARFDWLFIGMKDVDLLGPYSVGYRIFEGINLLGPAILRGTFPRLSQSALASRETFLWRVSFLLKVMLLANTLVAACAILHVENVLRFFYEEKYLAAVGPTMLLICSIPLLGVSGALYHAFLSQKLQRILLYNGIILAVLNVTINLYAIPRWGTMGAAFASSFPYVVGVVTSWFFYRRTVGELRLEWAHARCLLPALPTLLFGKLMLSAAPQLWMLIGALQVIVFIGCAWAVRPLNAEESQQLMKVIKRKT